jgi:uncharacterized membrane protein
VDTGAVGTLLVRTIEPAGKEIRGSARVRRSDNNETITSTASNKPLDILPGSYVVECLSTPPQTKKDINVKAGEETKVDFVVQPPPAPAPAKKPGA